MKVIGGAVKFVIKGVASAGAVTIVLNAVKTTTPMNIGKVDKILIGVGGTAIAWMVGDKIIDYVEEGFDEFRDFVDEIKKTYKESINEITNGVKPEEAAK